MLVMTWYVSHNNVAISTHQYVFSMALQPEMMNVKSWCAVSPVIT